MAGRRQQGIMKNNLKVAKQFWHYMKQNNQLLTTRTELRHLYKCHFSGTLNDSALREVKFAAVLWCFRSKAMKVIEWKPTNDREKIVYRKGKKIAVDQWKEERQLEDEKKANLGVFESLKKKLCSRKHRKNLARDKNDVIIEPSADQDGIVYMNPNTKILQLTVTNKRATNVVLICSILGPEGPFSVDNRVHRIVSEFKKVRLGNQSVDFTVTLADSDKPGSYNLPVAFMFQHDNDKPFHIVKYIKAEIVDDVVLSLQPTTPYQRPKPVTMVHNPYVELERGEPPEMQQPNYVVPLPRYPIPASLRSQINDGYEGPAVDDHEIYSPQSYCEKFAWLLHVEELQMEVDIAKYKMDKALLVEEKTYLTLEVPGLAEKRPSLVRGDHLFVRELDADGEPEKKSYEGFVHHVERNRVFLKFSSSFHQNFIKNSRYQVDFKFMRTSLRLMHRAVEGAVPFLEMIPRDGGPEGADTAETVPRVLTICDRKVQENKEQLQAVQNIVAGTSKPYPYLVFGPPGTGKTVTIVEAIKQVLKNDPKSRILACAPSNSAADLMLERVAEHLVIPKAQMVRLNAFGRLESSVNKNVLDFCIKSKTSGYFLFPTKEEIERDYRFVVTTLISAGKLHSLGIPQTHFTHVFIDEAGQGMEPECLVPIVGLLGTEEGNLGQLVLAGDPKQLGPVLRSPVAIKHGLSMSFLERLMGKNFPCFNRQQAGKTYDPNVVTKLLNNYRSHPNIIELPNELFYDNELQACANEILRNSLCEWEGLKKKGFPVVFESVCGKDQREEKSPSFFNPEEVSVVLRYVKSLKEDRSLSHLKTSEIGIISPYHRQVQKIHQQLQKTPLPNLTPGEKIQDIKVGSVEEFQGQERKVIIISTVRSSEEFLQLDAKYKLGFLKNPKRFNVAITRAKALLVVIGNPYVLCQEGYWRKFIQFCMKNGSFSNVGGGAAPFQMPEVVDKNLAKKLEKLCLDENSLLEDEGDLTGADYEERPWKADED